MGDGDGSPRSVFQSILKDKLFTDPREAIEQRALWAHLEQQKGNEEPAREFVMEFRWPLKYYLPGAKRISAGREEAVAEQDQSQRRPGRRHLERRRRHHDPFTFGDSQGGQ